MITVFTLSKAVLKPWTLLQGRTLAYKLKVLRKVKLRETCPLPIGVARGPRNTINHEHLANDLPFSPILVFLICSIASLEIVVRPSGSNTGLTSTSCHDIGT